MGIPGMGLVRRLMHGAGELGWRATVATLERIYDSPRRGGGEVDPLSLSERRREFCEGSMEATFGRTYDWHHDHQLF